MKNLFAILAVTFALAVPAFAQFRGSGPYQTDLLKGVPFKVFAGMATNVSGVAYIGKDSFSITANFTTTNASVSNLWFQVTPAPIGITNTIGKFIAGKATLGGTSNVYVLQSIWSTNIPGCGFVSLTLTNDSLTEAITVTNLWVGGW